MTHLVNIAGIPTVILGPGDGQVAHQANEHISIEQMALGVEVYLKAVEGWMKDESTGC
jgi:acetylornithine deacetylase/succinyl-diaminopimelate desuccinylase-like protein